MSSRHFLKMSSARLQRSNFSSSKTSSRRMLKTYLEEVLKTCLEDVLKTCLEDVLKTCLEDVLKTCLEDVFKTSWRQTKCLLEISRYLHLTNLNVNLTTLYFINLYLTNLRRIQNASVRTELFRYSSYFEIQAAFLYSELKSLMTVRCCEIS